jgi:cytochrome P450
MLNFLGVHAIDGEDPPRIWAPHALGCAPQFRDNPIAFILESHRQRGDIVRFRLAHRNCYLLRHPDHIHHVLVERNDNYGKQTFGYDKMRLFLGNGLVTSEGNFWRRQRRIAQPAFHRKRIEAFGQTMTDQAADMVAEWEIATANGESQVRDIHNDMMRVTLRIIASTVLSIDVAHQEGRIGESITTLLEVFSDSLSRVVPIHEHLPTQTNRRWEAARNFLDQLIYEIIESRRLGGKGEGPGDLLDMLLEAVDEDTGESMSDLQLRDEVMTMFSAGHETTANALSFTLYELARHPDVLAELQAEVDALCGSKAPGLEHLEGLELAGRVIEESMRLHPPAWLLARSATEDDQVGRYRIRKGSIVFISPYSTHRHPTFWRDAERFDPDRFLPTAKRDRPRYAYLPFSGGPRVCIGSHFAEMEARLILAAIVQRFDLILDERTRLDYDPSVTLRPHGGLFMRIRPRAL